MIAEPIPTLRHYSRIPIVKQKTSREGSWGDSNHSGIHRMFVMFIDEREQDKSHAPLLSQEWGYLAEGEMHFILCYLGHHDHFKNKVLRIMKHKKKEPIHILIDSHFDAIYRQYLHKIGIFGKVLLPSEVLHVTEEEKTPFLEDVWERLKLKSKSKKETSGLNFGAPIEILDNLLSVEQEGYVCLIEIKPKSPVYDKYDMKTLQTTASLHEITVDQLLSSLKELPERLNLQKNKREVVRNKAHQNLIPACNFFRGEPLNYLGQNKSMIEKYYYKREEISLRDLPISPQELNQAVFRALHKEDIFDKLLSVIFLYTKSLSRLKTYSCESILSSVKSLDPDKLVDELSSITLENYHRRSFHQENTHVDRDPIPSHEYSQLLETLSYLLSGTFRDVSIFLKIVLKETPSEIRVSEKMWCDTQLMVLDYELKSVYRTKGKYIDEDEEFLGKLVLQILKKELDLSLYEDKPPQTI